MPGTALAQQAPDLILPRNNLGGVGLIEMPSARMTNDGTLGFSASFMKNTQHYNLTFQALPWLETSFRYSGLSHFDPNYPVYFDRSFGIKARLFEEGDILPALAIGLNDAVGTGLYSGEYVVASKQFGSVDTTFGIGFGRLGSVNTFKNPLASIFPSLERERPGLSIPGGTPFSSFFHGRYAGVFGGAVWHTPLDGLSLIAEYSSDAYRFERQQGNFTPRNQINFGASYQLTSGVQINLDYDYGRALSGSIAFALDPTKPQFPVRLGAPLPQPVIRSHEAQQEALRTLLGQRDVDYAVRRAGARTRNAFVDELLANPAVGNVAIAGHAMTVTLAGNANSQTLCRAAAGSTAGSSTGISEILVRTSSGATVARCAVPRQVQAPFELANLSRLSLSLADYQSLTIDATDVQPPADHRAALKKFRSDAKVQGIGIEAAAFNDAEAIVYYTNDRYQDESDVIERLGRLLMADAPTDIEKFRLVQMQNGVAQQEFRLLRTPLERALDNDTGNASVFDSPVTITGGQPYNPILSAQTKSRYPHIDYDFYPQFRQQFFDPTNPLGVQVVGAVQADLELAPGLVVWGEAEANIFDTFSTSRASDSLLPHVRTDFVQYFTQGKNGIGALQANYRAKLTPELYATVKAGYLESMFAGAGGEVLYRPENARWAVGADLYEVKQRNFDRLIGLQPYHVTTGHVSFYWDTPFYDLNLQLRAGQYLAGDRGITVQVSRRFETGVEIGAFFTKTNVSAKQFGEGSFDKGILIRIPLGYIAPINTQNSIGLDLRPVQRDGGQFLLGDATLYEETRRASESEMVRHGDHFADF